MENWLAGRPAGRLPSIFFYVGKSEGHEWACRQSISNQIGTNRKLMNKSIVLEGQKYFLNPPGSTFISKTSDL